MDQTARRRRRNLIQNIAIALLSVSAVLLFAQLQLYNLGTSEDPLYLEPVSYTHLDVYKRQSDAAHVQELRFHGAGAHRRNGNVPSLQLFTEAHSEGGHIRLADVYKRQGLQRG